MKGTAVEFLRGGKDPMHTTKMAVELLKKRTGGEGGLILLDPFGRVGYAYNTMAMSLAFMSGDTVVVRD